MNTTIITISSFITISALSSCSYFDGVFSVPPPPISPSYTEYETDSSESNTSYTSEDDVPAVDLTVQKTATAQSSNLTEYKHESSKISSEIHTIQAELNKEDKKDNELDADLKKLDNIHSAKIFDLEQIDSKLENLKRKINKVKEKNLQDQVFKDELIIEVEQLKLKLDGLKIKLNKEY